MPTYDSQCKTCNKEYKVFRKISQSDDMPICCGVKTTKIFNSAPMFFFKGGSQFNAYQCPVTDEVVTNPKKKQYIEDKHDLIIKEPGIVKNPVNNRAPKEKLPDELKPELDKELAKMNS